MKNMSLEEIKSRNTELFLQLMMGEITNEEFEEATGAIPTKDNPHRKAWEERNINNDK